MDEDYKKPKNLADQLVRLLDDPRVQPQDRLRLIALYVLYRGGLLSGDIIKLLAHSQLPPQDGEVIRNFDLLGARAEKPLKDTRQPSQPLFVRKPPTQISDDDTALSRFDPNLKLMLQDHIRGSLDTTVFPSTRPPMDGEDMMNQDNISQASLRSAKPTWARTRPFAAEPRQRIIVFMAGGATYSEARSCYELSQAHNKDVYLVTSHMLTPALFLRQVGDLSADKRRLNLPGDQPKPKAPAHLFEREMPKVQPPSQTPQQQRPPPPSAPNSLAPPAAGLGALTMSSQDDPRRVRSAVEPPPARPHPVSSKSEQKLNKKDKDKDKKDKKDKEKKKRFFK